MLLYKDNLKGDETPHFSECSDDVIRYWFNPTCRYENEFQEASGCEAYCRRTSERVFVRNLLGLSDLEKDHAQSLAEKYPFGTDGPTLASLLSPSVFAAMALVPLTPVGGESRRPVLARLYCVRGLDKRFFPTELDVNNLDSGRGYSWFLTGLDEEDTGKRIEGRSWLLAAELLRRVVEKRDRETARHLMAKYIVTGDVNGDRITKVEMGRKSELGHKRVFADLKWIVPKENEVMDIAKRKVEKPGTLEEAWELIEAMQNRATRSFFRFLRDCNLNGMKEQFGNGADLFACEGNTGAMPIEIVGQMKEGKQKEQVLSWLRSQGADCAWTFYILAKLGLDEALNHCEQYLSIEARTVDGLNATELALINGDFNLARKLYARGCKCRAEPPKGSLLSQKVNACFDNDFSKKVVINALSVGLSTKCTYHKEDYEDDSGYLAYGYFSSLFGAALYRGNYELVEKCLDSGADPNEAVVVYSKDPRLVVKVGPEVIDLGYGVLIEGSPLYVVNKHVLDLPGLRQRISELLYGRGAKKDAELESLEYAREVKRYLERHGTRSGNKERDGKILALIDEGQPIDIEVFVKYVSAEDESKSEQLATTLWGAAVYYGDVDLMRKCLEHSASIHEPLKFSHAEDDKVADLQYLNNRTPIEVVLMSEDISLSDRIAAEQLLREFGVTDNLCSKALLSRQHREVLGMLHKRDDVEERYELRLDDEGACLCVNSWERAVRLGWSDVCERCLELGSSARGEIKYERYDEWNPLKVDLYDRGTPREYVLKNDSLESWERNRLLKLLRKYSNE